MTVLTNTYKIDGQFNNFENGKWVNPRAVDPARRTKDYLWHDLLRYARGRHVIMSSKSVDHRTEIDSIELTQLNELLVYVPKYLRRYRFW